MRLISLRQPLMTLAALLTIASAAAGFAQAPQGSQGGPRRTNVVASGRLTATRDLQQVVTWQANGATHLAIETAGSPPRVLWRMDGARLVSRVDSIRISDLDGDGIPEIISLWWKGSSGIAALRVFHWDRSQNTFVELQYEDELNNVHGYRVQTERSNGSTTRLVVDTRSDTSGRRGAARVGEYELRGSKLVRVGGGPAVTTQGESGIEGQAIISPSHPGPVRQGMPNSAPYKTTLVVWSAGDDREVTRFETGSDGRFRVALPPGDYRIGAPPQKSRFLPRASEETVTVARGKFVSVTINFDSGMR